MIAFQFFYPIFCIFKIQFYESNAVDKFDTVLSENISKVACTFVLLREWTVW